MGQLRFAGGDVVTGGGRPVVAMVTDAVYPYNPGGKEVRYHELTRRLARRADVHVYTMRWWPGPRTRTEAGGEDGSGGGGAVSFHAISPLFPLYTGGRRSLREAGLFALATLRLSTRRFDVLEADHIPYLQILTLRLVASVRRKPLVVTWHEVWGPAAWREYLGPQLGAVAWFTEWLAMRLPDHIIAASEQTADRLRAIIGARVPITVAPSGIDLAAIRATPPGPAPVDLVTVGRLLPHKRIDLLLGALALVRDGGRPVTCRVIGDGPDRDALRARARDLGVADAVDFRPDVSTQNELYALVKAARVFIAPSEREGFGIAVLEALACGLPVVTTSAPDNLARHLAARDPGSVVCEPTVAAIATAVAAVLDRAPAPAPIAAPPTSAAPAEAALTSASTTALARPPAPGPAAAAPTSTANPTSTTPTFTSSLPSTPTSGVVPTSTTSTSGTVDPTSPAGIADAAPASVASGGAGPGDDWLDEYSWDAVAGLVAGALGL